MPRISTRMPRLSEVVGSDEITHGILRISHKSQLKAPGSV